MYDVRVAKLTYSVKDHVRAWRIRCIISERREYVAAKGLIYFWVQISIHERYPRRVFQSIYDANAGANPP